MGKAKIEKQLFIQTKNQVGQLAEVTSILTNASVNITGICAWGEDDKACFAILTNNNAKAQAALKQKGLDVEEQEVVTMMLEDKVGAAQEIAQKIKKAGINLDCVYGTTCGCPNKTAMMVFSSKENPKLIAAINQ